jgi:hypothetical protein
MGMIPKTFTLDNFQIPFFFQGEKWKKRKIIFRDLRKKNLDRPGIEHQAQR